MGRQQGDGFFERRPVGTEGAPVVVGSGQFAVHLGGAFFGGDGFQRVDDLLVSVLGVPSLALFQQILFLFLILGCFYWMRKGLLFAWHGALSARLSALSAWRSALSTRLSVLPVRLSALSARLSVLLAWLSALPARHGALGAASAGAIQFLAKVFTVLCHGEHILLRHQLVQVIAEGISDKVGKSPVHGGVLFRRGGHADEAGGRNVLVQVVEVYRPVDAALQQDGGQIRDQVDGEVKIHLPALGIGKHQIFHCLVEVPVLLVQSNLGKDFAEGNLILILIFQKFNQVQAVVCPANVVAPIFFDIHLLCPPF